MAANRLQMYALLYAFERDVRSLLHQFVSSQDVSSEELMGNEYSKISSRLVESEGLDMEVDPVDLLDLRPSYDLLNRHKGMLPPGLAREVRANTDLLDAIVPIRHRIMHARPLAPDDAERLVSALSCFVDVNWKLIRSSLASLSGENWIPDVEPEIEPDRVLHNLPAADYDETGLIGRNSKVNELARLLSYGRDPVLTLTGEGGIGKTALALDVAYRLVEDVEVPFEVILWVSLKQERLTAVGVEQIRDSIASLVDATDRLGRDIDESFQGGLDKLSEALDGVNTLICIDNLETVSGEEFVVLYEALPNSVRYLVTSRNGIGQIERRFPVEPLESGDAVALMSKLIKSRNVLSLKTLSGDSRREAANALRRSPLGIRWWVLACAAGRSPVELINDQSELLAFCVRSVYDALSPGAQRIAIALDVLSGEASLHRISTLSGGSVAAATESLQELVRGSLVQSRVEYSASFETFIALTETAKRYLAISVPAEDSTRRAMIESDTTFREDEERRLRDVRARTLDPVVIHHRFASDAPVCQKLRRAILVSREGDIEGARYLIEEAREMVPDFWEVDRVDAFIESFHLPPEAVSNRYLRALEKCAEDEQRAVCSHFYSGHLARNVRDLEGALTHAVFAHEHLAVPETLSALGNAQFRMGKFEEGINSLREAERSLDGKARLIAVTSLVSAHKRWSDYGLSEERNIRSALSRAQQGVEVGLVEFQKGVVDDRLMKATEEALSQLLRCARHLESQGSPIPTISWGVSPVELLIHFNSYDGWRGVASNALGLQSITQERLGLDGFIAKFQDGPSVLPDILTGSIHSLLNGFGFIRNDHYPSNVFFHQTALRDVSFSSLSVGAIVRFSVYVVDGKEKAEWVELDSW